MKRVGVIGGGQLAWMMATPAKALGIELVVQTPSPDDPAVAIATDTIIAPIDNADATKELARRCDIITFENEFVDLAALFPLAESGVCFRPRLEALSPLLDKYHQRCYLEKLGIPQPQFEIPSSYTRLNFPVVLKTRRHGYDGQGTFIIKDLATLQHKLSTSHQSSEVLLEEFIPFERELAVIVARAVNGDVVTFPIVETQQENQVCRHVIAPAEISSGIAQEIEAIAHTLMKSLQAVGVFGIELFLTPDKVLVNEIAPRTHNSGHFTIDACATSQFEQHLRAVCDLPLGHADLTCSGAVMVNLLGYEHAQDDYLDKRMRISRVPHTHVHWYGKQESRPGRKLGHVTVLLDERNPQVAQAIAQKIESLWYPE
ncbi:5-(carboxyamino)imidazole ribonucleotide synthase [Gloeocapsopsis sp. AAB1 = 1H9]|uniref:N5-carboxyaminoimidazole ribonucleotide synthase n=1 Tax=Gloeocapsopsis dulcis AAB1 = 1H9 TaxID=1433147 RepID=A0A6N8FW68_9CHRO|nr:5-(carboxyamino)imidazole ribonucleotide synthase [Gloeocapsopsis dulcis AAB1 = 1H9]